MDNVIHRKTNYIKFISGMNTNATNAGGLYTARKIRGWHLRDEASGQTYSTTIGIIRTLVNNGGRIVAQDTVNYTLGDKLLYTA